MTGFESQTSGVGSDRSANWATTTAQIIYFLNENCLGDLLHNPINNPLSRLWGEFSGIRTRIVRVEGVQADHGLAGLTMFAGILLRCWRCIEKWNVDNTSDAVNGLLTSRANVCPVENWKSNRVVIWSIFKSGTTLES